MFRKKIEDCVSLRFSKAIMFSQVSVPCLFRQLADSADREGLKLTT